MQLGSMVFYSGSSYTFQWTAQEDAASYRFSLLSSEGGIVSSQTVSGTQCTVSIPSGTVYGWQVEALDGAGRILSRTVSDASIYFAPGKASSDDLQVIAASSSTLLMEKGYCDLDEDYGFFGYIAASGKEKKPTVSFVQGSKISSGEYAVSGNWLLKFEGGELYEKQGGTYVLRSVVGGEAEVGGLVDSQSGRFWIGSTAYAYAAGKTEKVFELQDEIIYWDSALVVTGKAVYRLEGDTPILSQTPEFDSGYEGKITASSQFIVGFDSEQALLQSYQLNANGTATRIASLDFGLQPGESLKIDYLELCGNRLLVDADIYREDDSPTVRRMKVYEFQNGSWTEIYTASKTGASDSYYWKDASTLVCCVETGATSTIKLPDAPQVPGEVPDVPENLTVKISKYNVTLAWDKIGISGKGAKVSYEIQVDGKTFSTTRNSYSVKNLDPGDHTWQIRAVDSLSGSGEWSTIQQFGVADVTAPKLGKVTAAVDGYTGVISWSGSDNVGVEYYEVRCADQVQVVSGTSARFENLAVGKYNAEVTAFDAAGNASKAGKVSIAVKDATPPEKVTGLVEPEVDAKYKAVLSWDPGVDNSGKVANYEIQLDDGKILKSSKTTLNVSNLSVGEHSYKVRAIDKDKNVGEWSEVQTFVVEDMTAPGSVSAKAKVEGNSLFLSWKTPKDNVGVTGYLLQYGEELENSAYLAADVLEYRIDGIARGSYQYRLTAFDAAGNESKPKIGKATIKTDLPVAELNGESPVAMELCCFEPATSALPADDPLAFCNTLRLDAELSLSASELVGSLENERRSESLFATAS